MGKAAVLRCEVWELRWGVQWNLSILLAFALGLMVWQYGEVGQNRLQLVFFKMNYWDLRESFSKAFWMVTGVSGFCPPIIMCCRLTTCKTFQQWIAHQGRSGTSATNPDHPKQKTRPLGQLTFVFQWQQKPMEKEKLDRSPKHLVFGRFKRLHSQNT